jgi:acetyl-CoA synthetase
MPEVTSYETVSHENRKFAPHPDFAENAYIGSMETYQKLYDRSIADPEGFWADAAEELHWFKKWDSVLDDSDAPFYKWFSGARTNVCYNCVDRHLDGPNRNKAAIIWEGEPGETRVLTYQDVYREVCKFANGSRVGTCSVGMCAYWRGPYGDFRWFLG